MKWPCFYGIDFATRAELIANGLSVDEIRKSIGADSLAYISLDAHDRGDDARQGTSAGPASTASYPMELPEPELLGKHLLEPSSAPVDVDAAWPSARRPVAAATEALSRP